MATPTPPIVTQPERIRLKISDIAWGVFWGLTAWTVIAFLATFVLAGLLAAAN
jgi:hypothetical protein